VDGVFAKIHELSPDKILHTVIDHQVCPNMKKVTLDKIIDVLENETNEVILEEEFMNKALKPLERMLELAK
ncbi:MAG: quinolinate synthase NadA, partial [Faecalibacillus sp.]